MMMPLGLWVVVGWMILVAAIGLALLAWGWKNGQFQDVESAKYAMLEDREPAPWPAKNGGTS
ncbi:MAG: cbb3-type cytochrome oxidase assembly protein [Ardenticatenaceae bacterium]|nr:cbb3-type cytochrome oxidase assembly protein [Anaerolineales bacterium]MCB8920170.1 cbb3-type cytochrome oxidase assembly protein [Ardenticatenaceae bacterium]